MAKGKRGQFYDDDDYDDGYGEDDYEDYEEEKPAPKVCGGCSCMCTA